MYSSIDVVNVKSDYLALKESFKQISRSFVDICCLMDRLEYFLGHFEDSELEDDLPIK